MGGDYAPHSTLHGALLASKQLSTDEKIVLIGDSNVAKEILQQNNAELSLFEFIHADDQIAMNEHATKAIRKKPNNSISVGFEALKNGEINTVQFTRALENSSKGFLNNFSPEVLRAGGVIGEVGNALTIFNRRFADLSELTEQQRLDVENLTASITTTQESFRQLSAQFQGLQTNVLQALAPGLTTLLNGTTGAINQANNAINFLSREAPGLVGAAVITGLAGKYLFEYAAQVGIIATGVRLGMFGPRGFGAAFRGILGPLLRTLRTLNTPSGRPAS